MNRYHVVVMLAAGLLMFGSSPAWSNDVDEMRQRAKAFMQEAKELFDEGRKDEADKLKRQAVELLQAAKQADQKNRAADLAPDLDRQIKKLETHATNLRNQLGRLVEEGAAEQEQAQAKERILAIEEELDQLKARRKALLAGMTPQFRSEIGQEHAAMIDAETERIGHLISAAEHLDAAGVHDLAGQLRSKAEGMKKALGQKIQQLKEHAHRDQDSRDRDTDARLDELQQLVKQLQLEIRELRQQAAQQ